MSARYSTHEKHVPAYHARHCIVQSPPGHAISAAQLNNSQLGKHVDSALCTITSTLAHARQRSIESMLPVEEKEWFPWLHERVYCHEPQQED